MSGYTDWWVESGQSLILGQVEQHLRPRRASKPLRRPATLWTAKERPEPLEPPGRRIAGNLAAADERPAQPSEEGEHEPGEAGARGACGRSGGGATTQPSDHVEACHAGLGGEDTRSRVEEEDAPDRGWLLLD